MVTATAPCLRIKASRIEAKAGSSFIADTKLQCFVFDCLECFVLGHEAGKWILNCPVHSTSVTILAPHTGSAQMKGLADAYKQFLDNILLHNSFTENN